MSDSIRPSVRIAIVAPALALRAGLRAILAGTGGISDPDQKFEVVFESASLNEFMAYAPQADLLLLDGELSSDLEQLASLPEGGLALLVLSGDPQAARRLLKLPLRGWGVLPLDATPEELAAALQAVHQGLVVGTSVLLEPALSRLLVVGTPDEIFQAEPLTEREDQVLQLLALGLANKQIAHQLSISEHTVKFHVSSIYGKLGAANRTEAVRTGVQRGLISL